jgi:hypothetical protein
MLKRIVAVRRTRSVATWTPEQRRLAIKVIHDAFERVIKKETILRGPKCYPAPIVVYISFDQLRVIHLPPESTVRLIRDVCEDANEASENHSNYRVNEIDHGIQILLLCVYLYDEPVSDMSFRS